MLNIYISCELLIVIDFFLVVIICIIIVYYYICVLYLDCINVFLLDRMDKDNILKIEWLEWRDYLFLFLF